jgi:PleD family two-component response regulator
MTTMNTAAPRTILVDPDVEARAILRAFFHELGHEVLEATTKAEAYSYIDQKTPELVVADWSSTDSIGLDVARWIRRQKNLRSVSLVLMISSLTSGRTIELCDVGIHEYLWKPCSHAYLHTRDGLWRSIAENKLRRIPNTLIGNSPTFASSNCAGSAQPPTETMAPTRWRRRAIDRAKLIFAEAAENFRPIACVSICLGGCDEGSLTVVQPDIETAMKELRARLQQSARAEDEIIRTSECEYSVLMPELTLDDLSRWASKFQTDGEDFPVSIGLAERRGDITTFEQLVEAASRAALAAQRAGSHRVCETSGGHFFLR